MLETKFVHTPVFYYRLFLSVFYSLPLRMMFICLCVEVKTIIG
jgi:hypothetical protein